MGSTLGFNDIQGHGYCPFRVEIHNHIPGCMLRYGKDTPCYSTDDKPLLFRNNVYTCPLVPEVAINIEIYGHIDDLTGSARLAVEIFEFIKCASAIEWCADLSADVSEFHDGSRLVACELTMMCVLYINLDSNR